jgi:hypothetical protein
MYVLGQDINYHSHRYNRNVYVPWGRESDGATGAKDLKGPIRCLKNGRPYMASLSWWVHDELCLLGMWKDGTKVTNWQASMVLRDILKSEGHGFRARTWTWATYLFGGGKARKN